MNLAATLTLNNAGFLGPLNAIRRDLAGVLGHIKGLGLAVTGLGAVFAAFKSGESIVENLFKQFEKGHELERLSRITGESVKNLVILQKAFTNAGNDAGGVQHNISLLQKSLGGVNEQGEPTAHIFSQLHLSLSQLRKLSTPEQLEKIGAALRALPNAASRSAAAMAIFGRGGAEMLAVLGDPTALSDATKQASTMGAIYQRTAKIFSEIIVLFNNIKGKVGTLFAGIAEGVAPSLKAVLESLKSVDLAKIGQNIGSVLRAIPIAIQKGEIARLLTLTLEAGFAKAINTFSAAMKVAISGFGEVLNFTFSNLGSIADVLLGAAAQFGSAMLTAVQRPLAYVQGFFETLASHPLNLLNLARGNPIGLLGTKAETSSNAERIMREGGPKFGFGGKAMNATEIGEEGRKQANQGLAALVKPITQVVLDLGKLIRDAKIEDVAGSGKAVGELNALMAKLLPPLETAVEKAGARSGSALTGVGNAKDPLNDKLSRIGGFIGPGGPAHDFARRTAENTAQLVHHIRALPKAISDAMGRGPHHALGAAWH